MSALSSMFKRLAKEEDGASASEYAILVAFVAVAVAAAVKLFNLNGVFTDLGTKVRNLVNGAA